MSNDNLKTELDKFGEWACMNREEYSQTPDFGDWEAGYPDWDKLYSEANNVINLILTKNEYVNIEELLSLILEAIAIDNENEVIIKQCQSKFSNYQKFYEIATVHLQPEARRQVAKMIGNIGYISNTSYLRCMVDDQNKYVQRSAVISLAKIIPAEAEEIAFKKISEKDDYIRLFSLRVLKELASLKLDQAIEILKNDESEFIKQEIVQIKISKP